MATFQSRFRQRHGVLGRLQSPFAWGILLALALLGCAPQLPYAPPTPPQHLQQLSNQFELTNRLQHLTYLAYTLDAGDKIMVQVDGDRPLSREITVDSQGEITYPLLGKVKAAGLTLPELNHNLDSSLAKHWSKPRKVTTTITEYRDQHVYVLGEVRAPGVHPLQPSDSVLDLVSQAGGPTPEAGWLALVIKKAREAHDQIKVARSPASGKLYGVVKQTNENEAPPAAIRVDLDELLIGATAQSLRIENGDTIFIPEAAYFYIYGEVERPGRYRLKRGMTAIQAISQAGGYTAFATKKRLKVFRYHVHNEVCGGDLCLWGVARHVSQEPPHAYRLHAHDRIQPSDVLVVPHQFGS